VNLLHRQVFSTSSKAHPSWKLTGHAAVFKQPLPQERQLARSPAAQHLPHKYMNLWSSRLLV
jgi:hypothetical protein